MGTKILPQLNIRQKIILGITFFILAMGTVGLLSYRTLRVVEKKVKLVEIADDLSNIILEIRRYEKNFFLYGLSEKEALAENRRYIGEALQVLNSFSTDLKDLKGAPKINRIKRELVQYQEIVDQVSRAVENDNFGLVKALEESLRNKGKTLVDLSQELVRFERERILLIIDTLYTHLIMAMGIFTLSWGLLVFFVVRKIIFPLSLIEKTTLQIAEGKFQPLPVPNTKDETERVIRAFNRMVKELERRQDQLVQAKKLSSLGTLTSGIAHQLNNPLNNISTSCQIILEELDEIDKDFLKKLLSNAEQEIARARDIVRGLLEFSRVKEFSLVPTPISEIVKKASQLVSSQVPAGVEIKLDIPEDLLIPLDSQRMQQVFLNLFINALQAISQPPGQISVKVRKDTTTNEAVIEVIDTGAGIDEENLHHIFDPFFTTKEVGEGTGLGLSIVHGIIEQHHGSISVESKKNVGTKFIIRLPLTAHHVKVDVQGVQGTEETSSK